MRIAKETMEIYAPLSDRMGMNHIRDELEDLSFKMLNPEARNLVVDYITVNNKKLLEHAIDSYRDFRTIKKTVIVYNKKHKNYINKLNLK